MTAVTSSGPLAAQAHALHAAAVLLERAGIAGLLVSVDGTAFITFTIPDQLGDPAARTALLTALAATAEGGSITLGRRAPYLTGYGHAAGYPVTITTSPAKTP
jgi:hypothetical protein